MSVYIRELAGRDLLKKNSGFLKALETLSPVNADETRLMEAFLDRQKQGVKTFVAVEDDEVLGTASLLIEQKFTHVAGRVGHIEDVAVRPSQQRQGIGSALVLHCVDEAIKQNCYKVVLETALETVPFYIQAGFRQHEIGMRLDIH